MKSNSAREQGAQGQGIFSTPRLSVLHDHEKRIRDLQNQTLPRHSAGVAARDGRLRAEVDSALRTARTCAADGQFRRAKPVFLAGLVNGFSKVRQYPVIPEVDAIMAVISQEVERRAAGGALAHWAPRHQSLMANALGKGRGAWVQSVLTRLAQALLALPERELMAQWSGKAQSLAMMVNGLAKAEGQAVQDALQRLAQVVSKEDSNSLCRWDVQHLAMTANGLAKGEGDSILEALAHLAGALPEARQLTEESGWSARHLAMMASGLAKSEAHAVRQALIRLACSLRRRDLSRQQGWGAQSLAMMIHGLARGEGAEIQEALSRLAQAITASDPTVDQGWNARFLAMAAVGLGKAPGAAARRALARCADLVCQLELAHEKEGVDTGLAIILGALGQTLADHAAFARITSALVQRARLAPGVLAGLLGCLSRLALSAAHLKSASRLLEALRACDFRPGSRRERGEMLWNITLFHFASLQQQPVDQPLALSFAQCWHDWSCTVAARRDDRSEAAFGDLWHEHWAADYWQPSAMARRADPVTSAAVTTAIPWWQSQIFEQLVNLLPGHDVCQEIRIRHFPVDIVIDGRVCVEVDGHEHFVEMLVDRVGQAERALVRQRRTKDLFIDHMLRQYGYLVFRIDLGLSVARRDGQVRQVVAALEAPVPPGTAVPRLSRCDETA